MQTFEEMKLKRFILTALDELGYVQPTPIQKQSFSKIMSGKDVVGVAQTGTGKTFAYLLPLINMIGFSNQVAPRLLILVPTRELVVQQVEEVEKLTTYMNLRVVGAYGGTNINSQRDALYEGSDIVIGTPGRMLDLALDGALNLNFAKKLVLDEADEMLNLGFRTQLKNLFEMMPERRQNLLFSATMGVDVEALIEDFFGKYEKIEIAPHGTPLEQIEQSGFFVENFLTKVNMLRFLLDHNDEMSKVVVFVKTKKFADRLFEHLEGEFGERVGVIHGNKDQNYRLKQVEGFANGSIRILIATDIIARGIDIDDVTHVINYDMPEKPEFYIHRIGRSGRAGKNGKAISFVSDEERNMQLEIEALMDQVIPMQKRPENVPVNNNIVPEENEKRKGDKNYFRNDKKYRGGGAFHSKKRVVPEVSKFKRKGRK